MNHYISGKVVSSRIQDFFVRYEYYIDTFVYPAFLAIVPILVSWSTSIGWEKMPIWWEQTKEFLVEYRLSLFIMGVFVLRWRWNHYKRLLSHMERKHILHNLAHYVAKQHNVSVYLDCIVDCNEYIFLYLNSICDYIADYFRNELEQRDIHTAIRIAFKDNLTSKVVYRTFGRSSDFNKSRDNTSEDIPSDQGIVLYLEKNNKKGVLIYDDVFEASEKGLIMLTHNYRVHDKEIVSMMVTPITYWDTQKTTYQILGLLYVSSPKKSMFSVKHVDSMRFMSDFMSPYIQNLFSH